ncbi:hypothetical protein TrRE_jg8785, partial [Triparma retinervis]
MQSREFLKLVQQNPSLSKECTEVLGTPTYTSSSLESLITLGYRSRDSLASHSLRLVHHVVSTVLLPRPPLVALTHADLVQEGTIGLLRSIDKYDPVDPRGASLATYSSYWIKASVLRAIAEKEDIVRPPLHIAGAVRKIVKARAGAWGEYADARKIALETGMGEGRVRDALGVMGRRGGYVELVPGYHEGG